MDFTMMGGKWFLAHAPLLKKVLEQYMVNFRKEERDLCKGYMFAVVAKASLLTPVQSREM